MTSIPIDELDRDGALREAEDGVAGGSRADFLKKAVAAGGGLAGGGALLGLLATEGRAQTATDVSILNFALTLEELEAAFYREAVAGGALTGAGRCARASDRRPRGRSRGVPPPGPRQARRSRGHSSTSWGRLPTSQQFIATAA
ncbi:MAG: ferritin-like domain-containing protein [Thermoleophilaceae bacterium]